MRSENKGSSRRFFVRLVQFIAAAVFLIIAFGAGVFFYITTPSGSHWVILKAKTFLERNYGAQIDFEEAAFDLKSYIHLKNFKILLPKEIKSSNKPSNKPSNKIDQSDKISVNIPALDIKYGFSLFSKRAWIDDITANRIHIIFHYASKAKQVVTQKENSGPKTGAKFDIAELGRLVSAPPVLLTIRKLKIENLSLDVAYSTPVLEMKTLIPSLSIRSDLEWAPPGIHTTGEINLAKSDISAVYTQKAANTPASSQTLGTSLGKPLVTDIRVQLYPDLALRWSGGIEVKQQKWKINFDPIDMKLNLSNLAANETGASGIVKFIQNKINVSGLSRLAIETLNPMELGRNLRRNLILFESHNSIKTGSGSLELSKNTPDTQNSQNTGHSNAKLITKKIEFSSQILEFSTKKTDRVETVVHYLMSQLFSKGDLLKPTDLSFDTTLTVPLEGRRASGNMVGQIAFLKLFDMDIAGHIEKNGEKNSEKDDLILNGKGALFIPVKLRELFKAASQLKIAGDLEADAEWDGKIPDGGNPSANIKLFLKQNTKGQFHFDPLSVQAGVKTSGEDLGVSMRLSEKLFRGFGLSVGDIDAQAELGWKAATHEVQCQANVRLKKEDTFSLTTKAQLNPSGMITAAGSAGVIIGNQLQGILKPEQMKSLKRLGKLKTEVAFDLQHHAELKNGGEDILNLSALVSSFTIDNQYKLGDIKVSSGLKMGFIPTYQNIDFHFDVQQPEGVQLLKQNLKLSGLKMEVAGHLRNADRWVIDSFSGQVRQVQSIMGFSGEASGSLKKKEFQSQGALEINIPETFPEIFEQKISGTLRLPWLLSMKQGRQIHVQGNVESKNFQWHKGPMSVQGMSGRITFSEKLTWDGKNIRFFELITRNPFERVDYGQIHPLLEDANQFRIAKIGFEGMTYGPLNGIFSVNQNMLFANEFNMKLGSGQAYGEMYMDFSPANLSFGLLARMTHLNLEELLPKKYLIKTPEGSKSLSGRSNLVMNINRGSVDGRVDVTEIGKSQLITMVNVLDPEYKNEQMNKARTLLGIAYPAFVGLSFQEGYLDMSIDLEGLISQKLTLRGIPLSTWITAATSGILKQTEKGPLK